MKIAIWGNTFPLIGGIEKFVDCLGHGLTDRGHEILVISDGRRAERLEDRSFPVETIPMAEPVQEDDPTGLIGSVLAAKRVIAEFAPDLIHYHPSGLELPIFSMATKKLATPIITTIHFDLNNPYMTREKGTLARLLSRSARITAVSRFVRDLGKGARSLPGREIVLIENALPGQEEYKPPPQDKVILALGRLVADKGFDLLIQAMPSVVDAHPDARLIIAGAGPENEALRQQVVAAELEDHVEFVGWVKPHDVPARIANSSMVVVPSRWEEPFGLVAVEAAQSGRPCVAFAVGGLADTIKPGTTGALANPEDPVDLARQINILLSDTHLAKQQGRQALTLHGGMVSFNRMLDAYERTYNEVVAAI